jgi:proteasome lid subunit RPN8/RPN11
MNVSISDSAVEAIRQHGSTSFPYECCGALIERGGVIIEALPLTNTTSGAEARTFHVISGEGYREAEARARTLGGNLAGFYHSHPDAPARPSARDLEHAWPNLLYLIVSVRAGTPDEMTAWRLRDDRSGFDKGALQARPAATSSSPSTPASASSDPADTRS